MADEGLIILAGVLLSVLVAVPLMVGWRNRQVHRWNAMGEALGLRAVGPARHPRFLEGYRTLRGAHGRFEVQVRHFTTGSGDSEDHWTAVEVPVPAADPGFALRVGREGLGSALAKAFGGQDVETGHADFDARFRVRSSDPPRAQRVLDATVRAHLDTLERFGDLRIEPGLPLADETWVDAAAARGFLRVPGDQARVFREVASALGHALPAEGGQEVALVRYLRKGVVLDAEDIAPVLPVVARVAEALEAAAPHA